MAACGMGIAGDCLANSSGFAAPGTNELGEGPDAEALRAFSRWLKEAEGAPGAPNGLRASGVPLRVLSISLK